MSYKTFDLPTMAAVSAAWVDPKQQRPALLGIPTVAPLMPMVDASHQMLVDIGGATDKLDALLKSLSDKADGLDGTHDKKFRGGYNVLTDWSELVDDITLSQSLVTLRDQLFRDGLNGVRRTYLAEAGNVDIAEQNLTDEMRALLSSITCGPVTLMDEVEAWIAAGTALGQVERERVQLADEDTQTISAGEMSKVRAQWAKVTNALLTNLDLAGVSVDAETRNRILQPLKEAEKKQAQAARRRAAAKERLKAASADEALNAPLPTDSADDTDTDATLTGEA